MNEGIMRELVGILMVSFPFPFRLIYILSKSECLRVLLVNVYTLHEFCDLTVCIDGIWRDDV